MRDDYFCISFVSKIYIITATIIIIDASFSLIDASSIKMVTWKVDNKVYCEKDYNYIIDYIVAASHPNAGGW